MPPTRNSFNCRIPRRHLPTTPTPSPPKDRTEVERSVVADRLVDSSVAIISSIWFSPLPASGNATPPSSQSSLCPLPSTSTSNDNINDAPSPSPFSSSEEYDIFSTQKNCTAAPQLPLRLFIRESLRRSRTSCSTLQAALLYCVRAQRAVMAARLEGEGRYDDAVRLAEDDDNDDEDGQDEMEKEGCSFDRERGYVLADSPAAFAALANITSLSTPLPQENEADPIRSSSTTRSTTTTTDLLTPPPSSPKRQERELNAPIRFSLSPANTATSKEKEKEKEMENSILLCGRRMFLASVMVASKFLQDHNYSYHAWSRISGLPVSELGLMERSFLRAVGYDLVVRRGGEGWAEWVVELEGRAERERVRVQGEVVGRVMREVLDFEDEDSDSDMGDEDEGGKEKRAAGGEVVAGANALALAISGGGQKCLLRPKGTVLARPPLPSSRTSSSSSSSYSSSSSSASSLRYTPYGTGPAVAKMTSHGGTFYVPPSSSSASVGGSYHHYFSHHGLPSSSSAAAFQLPLSALSS